MTNFHFVKVRQTLDKSNGKPVLQYIEMWNLFVMAATLCNWNKCQYDHPATWKASRSICEQAASSFPCMTLIMEENYAPNNLSTGREVTYVYRHMFRIACIMHTQLWIRWHVHRDQAPSPEFFYLTAAEKIAMFSWDQCVCQIPFSYTNLRYTDASASGCASFCTIHDKMLLPLHGLSCSGCLWFKLCEDS